jgi:hypothetical protein
MEQVSTRATIGRIIDALQELDGKKVGPFYFERRKKSKREKKIEKKKKKRKRESERPL